MRLDELKNEFPNTPAEISQLIEMEVQNQMKLRNTHNKKWKKVAAIGLIAIMAVGTTAFAANAFLKWNVQKEGNYGLKLEIDKEKGTEVEYPEEIPVLSVKPEYLPEGMVAEEGDVPLKYYSQDTPYTGGFSIEISPLNPLDSEVSNEILYQNVTYSEQLSLNGLEVIYMEMKQNHFNKKIEILYPDYWQIIGIYVGEDMSKEEAIRFAENLKVEPTGEMRQTSKVLKPMEEPEEESRRLIATSKEMETLHQIGEAFDVDGVQVKVTDVQVTDDNSLLQEEHIDSYLAGDFDEQGKLLDNKIEYIKCGDGINTIDEVMAVEKTKQKLVYVTLEYTNTSNTECNNILFFGDFMKIVKDGENYRIYDRIADKGSKEADSYIVSSRGKYGEMDYYMVENGNQNKNYIESIEPGETVKVYMAKLVNEDELDKLYLSLDSTANGFEFTSQGLMTGYVDIRQ